MSRSYEKQDISKIFESVPLETRKQQVCDNLSKIHGQVFRRKEASGEHVYMACPDCLQEAGRRELSSRHLAFNLDRYFSPDRIFKNKGKGAPGYACCMKTGLVFTLEDLLNYPTLSERGIPDTRPKTVKESGADRDKYLITDKYSGERIPSPPGDCRNILDLPTDHPAMEFIRQRDFDPVMLANQFEVSYCEKESIGTADYNPRKMWRNHASNWRSTPQGRVIFYVRTNGVIRGWQARYIEVKDDKGNAIVWHPYRLKWERPPAWDDRGPPVKYLTSPGFRGAEGLPGWDHVVRMDRLYKRGYCVLTEGPLDAARFPENGLAIFGKHLGETRALLISSLFRRVVLGFDSDKGGREACRSAEAYFDKLGVRTVRLFPGDVAEEQKRDLGDMTYHESRERLEEALTRM